MADREFFPDVDIVRYVEATYGLTMANRVLMMLQEDADNETAFVRSVRRSLTREMERKMTRA